MQALAEAQQDYITRRLREVENLSDAIKWLGLANFRRYSAMEVLPAVSVSAGCRFITGCCAALRWRVPGAIMSMLKQAAPARSLSI